MAPNQSCRVAFDPRDLLAAARLWVDPKVPVYLKLIPVLVMAYIVSPVDLLPDVMLGLGLVDDLAVLLMGLRIFADLAASARARQPRPQPGTRAMVEGSYRIID